MQLAEAQLRKYIRQILLAESIDSKIMSMIDRAEKAGFRALIRSGYVAVYDPSIDVSGYEDGYVGFKNSLARVSWHKLPGSGAFKCSGARRVIISSAEDFGMGPLAYDIAIEATGGLMPDRIEVSDEARAVWDYYLNSRSDVQSFQLDNELDSLTPGLEDDNCLQKSARVVSGQREVPSAREADDSWAKSALSKMYKKSGTPVIDELRRRNMLDDER